MKKSSSTASRVAGLLAAIALLAAVPARSGEPGSIPPSIAAMAHSIAAELVMHCPLSAADDIGAFESCRDALQAGGLLRASLPQVVLWGRPNPERPALLWKTQLTQLAPEVWTQLYAPLFMFNGNHVVEWVPQENQYVIRLEAAFRNRLPPARFPYPFWQDAAQWNAYQHANALLLWVQPQTARIHVAQFTDRAATPLLQPVQALERPSDRHPGEAGRHSDANATLFDGLYLADNPHLLDLDRHYRDFALQLHDARCSHCHAPANPARAQRLVLLATPADAAGEVERVIATVRSARLPAAAGGDPHALTAQDREWLLRSADGFRDALGAARAWEAQALRAEQRASWPPREHAASLQPATVQSAIP